MEANITPKNLNYRMCTILGLDYWASFSHLGLISDPLKASEFHKGICETKRHKNKKWQGDGLLPHIHVVPVTRCSKVKYVLKRLSFGSKCYTKDGIPQSPSKIKQNMRISLKFFIYTHSKLLVTAVVSDEDGGCCNHNAVVDNFEFAFQDKVNTLAVMSNRFLCLFSFIRTYAMLPFAIDSKVTNFPTSVKFFFIYLFLNILESLPSLLQNCEKYLLRVCEKGIRAIYLDPQK